MIRIQCIDVGVDLLAEATQPEVHARWDRVTATISMAVA